MNTHVIINIAPQAKITVKKGEHITPGTVLAKEETYEIDEINLVKLLDVPGPKAIQSLQVKEGDQVTGGAIIAKKGGFLRQSVIKSPVDGIFTIIDKDAGLVGIKRHEKKEEIRSFWEGIVEEIDNGKIFLRVKGIVISGTRGIGQPVSGRLLVLPDGSDALTLPAELEERILVLEKAVSEIIAKANTLGAKAIITETLEEESSFPYVLVSDVSVFQEHHDKNAVVYGAEKQIVVF